MYYKVLPVKEFPTVKMGNIVKNTVKKNNTVFSPLMTWFSLLGIYIGNKHETYPRKIKFFAILYHILWVIGSLGTVGCLLDLLSSFYIFSTIVKMISICFWWIVFRSRYRIWKLLRMMRKLRESLGYTHTLNLWMLRLYMFVLFMFVIVPGINSVYDTVTNNRIYNPCFNFKIPLPNLEARIVAYPLIQINHQVVNWILSYLVAVLLIFCCMELNSLVRFFVRKKFHDKMFSIYESLFEAASMMEDTFSLPCFFVLVRLFMEFFRIFSLLFKFVKGKPESVSFINASSYASVTLLLFISMIFITDRLYSGYKELQRKMMSNMSFSKSQNFVRCFMKQLSVKKEAVTLTGWGIFEIKKKLLLATLASLITYGVLLQQLQQ